MDRTILGHLPVVLAVATRRSFAGAAAELGMGASAVSHAVRLVERRLGVAIFVRTTRSVALTEAGAALVARLQRGLDEIGRAADEARAGRGGVGGVLRLNAPRVAQPLGLTALLAEAGRRHPDLLIEVTTDDGLVDIVAGGFDAGIRLGAMIAADMVAVRLTPPFRAMMVAAPGYLAARGAPDGLAGLGRHNCIGYRLASTGATYAWDLAEAGRATRVDVSGSVRVTDPLHALDLALAGVGIAYLFEPLVRPALADGRLVPVLPACAIEEPGLFLYFPRAAAPAPKMRAFVDLVRRHAGRLAKADGEAAA